MMEDRDAKGISAQIDDGAIGIIPAGAPGISSTSAAMRSLCATTGKSIMHRWRSEST
jgi:hypothetical protein